MSIRQTAGRGRLYDSVPETVGNTPCIRINRIAPDNVTVYVKAEFFNPAASVKDRLALNIIEAVEREGRLVPGQTVVEATSGNTGIHENTTAREILADFKDQRLDYWVTGYGTGGTVTGVARVLRKERPETQIILTEPDNAPIVASGHGQSRDAQGSPAESHPHFQPHPIQGWTPGYQLTPPAG